VTIKVKVKVEEIELQHKEKQQRIKDLKARVISQIQDLDFSNLEHTQKIRVALSLSDTF